jgi:transcriptional regulator with XRE-family HTH domain
MSTRSSPATDSRAPRGKEGPRGRTGRAELSDIGAVIGPSIKARRAKLGVTLEEIAASTGFTRGYLSKIENSRKTPPIATLSRIAQALGTDIASFFQTSERVDADAKVSVVRAHERRKVPRGGSVFGYDYESVAYRKRHKHMEPFIFTYPPNLSRDVSFEHEGEELVFVLSGRVAFEAAGEKFVLEPGDTLYLDSAVPHRGHSLGGEAKAFVVIFKPEHAPASRSRGRKT